MADKRLAPDQTRDRLSGNSATEVPGFSPTPDARFLMAAGAELSVGKLAGALHARGDHEAAIAIAKDAVQVNQNDCHANATLCSALMAVGAASRRHQP